MKTIFFSLLFGINICISNAQNVIQLEYAIDVDNGVGSNTLVSVTPGSDITESIMATISSSIPVGNHKLYIRTKDQNNRWSQTVRRNIQIVANQTDRTIIMGEYSLDTDFTYGNGSVFNINPEQPDILQQFSAQIAANATIGYHKLYGRVKDSYGNWSHTFRKNIQVIYDDALNVVVVEYFFGNDPEYGNANTVTLPNPEGDGTWNFYVPYPVGSYDFNDALFVRAKDNNSLWSITTVLDEIDPNLSVANIDTLDLIKLYPNPFSDELFIKTSNNLVVSKIEITNIAGQIVYTTNEDMEVLNLHSLNPGIYFLKLETSGLSGTFKIIKR